MCRVLSSDTVLQPSGLCVARPQKDSYLFYHYRTDELHLGPPVGYYVSRLCEGLRAGGVMARLLTNGAGSGGDAAAAVRDFLEQLLVREILEVVDG